ncbi:MAG: DUF1667 domain-containing protein [Clostridia bacterium]|nr:DUF1667 domain-containing protein [Clostridia bacterium]
MNMICIMCPMGCPLTVEENNGVITVQGHTCPRGKKYGEQEFTAPVRVLTTLVKRADGGMASAKTSGPIPKDKVREAAECVGKIVVSADVKIGDIIEENFYADDVNLVITGVAQ